MANEIIPSDSKELEPMQYHRRMVKLLQDQEPEVWKWAMSQKIKDEQFEAIRSSMLRETYRLAPEAHGKAHELCHKAMQALAIEAPITLYQASDGSMNAALCFIPGEVHMVFYGAILEKLSDDELLALMGHELAHYRLWTTEGSQYHAVNRILDHALAYREATPSHYESSRLFALATELYADRGAALAVNSPEPAITMLVKVMTGLTSVDAKSFLKQASEIDAAGQASQGTTHPESFLRAQAVQKWWQAEPDTNEWIEARLMGLLSLKSLDLTRQHELTDMTKQFISALTADKNMQSDEVLGQIKRFFPKWKPSDQKLDKNTFARSRLDKSVYSYLSAIVCDLAMADRDIKDEVLTVGFRLMKELEAEDEYRAAMKDKLKLTKQAIDKLASGSKKAKNV
jgi:Peptidase family M48